MSLSRALALIPVFLSSLAYAGSVPTVEGQHASHLDMRVVSYDGHVNGGMTVEVTNTGNAPEIFAAQGLFFVPDANANEAPQRLGAVGPFTLDGNDVRRNQIEIDPGKKIVAHLEVYCIDSHRGSPSPATKFHVAKARMPAQLSTDINNAATTAAAPYGGVTAKSAKGAVQSEVWKNRDKKWVPLEGEGKQEDAKH